MEVTAVEGMINEMAQWIGILIRGGHARCCLIQPKSPPVERTGTVLSWMHPT